MKSQFGVTNYLLLVIFKLEGEEKLETVYLG